MKKYDVVTVGSGVVDVFVDTGMKGTNGKICYAIGEKIPIKHLNFSTGGGGTNTAASFSKLGLKTGFLGKIGDGHNAGIILRDLKKFGVDFLGVKSKLHTGYSIVLDSRENDRTIFTYKGAGEALRFGEIDKKAFNTKWFYFTSMNDEAFETQVKLAGYAFNKGIRLAYNPGMSQIKDRLSEVKSILKFTNVLIVNKQEAMALAHKKDFIKELKSMTIGVVCVTDGKNGCSVYDGEVLISVEAHKNVKCVERTGAGDAFGAGFVSGLIRTGDLEKAVQVGSLNAEGVIQIPGAKNGILSWSSAMRKMRENPVKVVKRVY